MPLLILFFLLYLVESITNLSPRTEAIVSGLADSFSWRIRIFLALCAATGWIANATSGARSAAAQNRLHEADSRNPAAGGSSHEWGRALDVNFTKGAVTLLKSTPKAVWVASGIPFLASLCGLRWGGNFSNYYDPIHFDAD
jgi:hypothetical protein